MSTAELARVVIEGIANPNSTRVVRREAERCEDNQAARSRLIEPLMRAWNTVPAAFRWASFDAPGLAERVKPAAAVEHARSARGSMLLIGPSGSGKTSLGAAMLRRAVDEALTASGFAGKHSYHYGSHALFATSYDIARSIAHSPLGAKPQLLVRCSRASLLVLDDLGFESEATREGQAALRELIHERHAAARDTVVTTFLRRDHLAARYGEGIARRLCMSTVVILGQVDS